MAQAHDEPTASEASRSSNSWLSERPSREETEQARIDRLGRQRPATLHSLKAEVGFVFSICMSQVITEIFVSGFTVIVPTLLEELAIPSTSAEWPAVAFSLPIADTLLFFGRLGDMYGGYALYLAGMAWLSIWSLFTGFSFTSSMLNVGRAMQGLGAAATLANGVLLMGSIYRPGPRKNFVFSIYGACAVIGFFFGILIAGLAGHYVASGWYFWAGAILALITTLSSYFFIPSDLATKRRNNIRMDWLGTALIASGLSMVVYAMTDSTHASSGWRTPRIPITFVLGSLLLAAAAYVEGWVVDSPLLPFDIFNIRSMKPLVAALLLNYGTLGVYLFYVTQYMQIFMGASPLQVVSWYVPMILGGLILSIGGGFVLHLVSGRALLVFSGAGWVGALLLFAVAPPGANYWSYTFPSAILATIGIDITFNIANIFITTHVPDVRLGVAGGLVNTILHLGIVFCLSVAGIIQAEELQHRSLFKSYKSVFWFGLATASVSLLLIIAFVKVDKAKSEYTVDERRQIEQEEKNRNEELKDERPSLGR